MKGVIFVEKNRKQSWAMEQMMLENSKDMNKFYTLTPEERQNVLNRIVSGEKAVKREKNPKIWKKCI